MSGQPLPVLPLDLCKLRFSPRLGTAGFNQVMVSPLQRLPEMLGIAACKRSVNQDSIAQGEKKLVSDREYGRDTGC